MSRDYGEIDPIIEKSQFIMSLCEQIISGHRFSRGQQSIIDRCTENVYREYQESSYTGTPPTLADFREELLRQPEREAKSLALERNSLPRDRSIPSPSRPTLIPITVSYAMTSWNSESSSRQ